jgi:hypothetical protein
VGKTSALEDLLVSVATGTPWLERFRCETGPSPRTWARVDHMADDLNQADLYTALKLRAAQRFANDDLVEGVRKLFREQPDLAERYEHAPPAPGVGYRSPSAPSRTRRSRRSWTWSTNAPSPSAKPKGSGHGTPTSRPVVSSAPRPNAGSRGRRDDSMLGRAGRGPS